jgi:hypothetical protein
MSSNSTCTSGGNCSSHTVQIGGILTGVVVAIVLAVKIFYLWRIWRRDRAKVKKRIGDVELPAYTPADPSLPSYDQLQSIAIESIPEEPAAAHLAPENGNSSYLVVDGTLPVYEEHSR